MSRFYTQAIFSLLEKDSDYYSGKFVTQASLLLAVAPLQCSMDYLHYQLRYL